MTAPSGFDAGFSLLYDPPITLKLPDMIGLQGFVHYIGNNGASKEQMEELIRTNDMVLISFLEALLKEQDINYLVLDQNMSIMEGSIGAIPKRILVEGESLAQAQRTMREAGLEAELGG